MSAATHCVALSTYDGTSTNDRSKHHNSYVQLTSPVASQSIPISLCLKISAHKTIETYLISQRLLLVFHHLYPLVVAHKQWRGHLRGLAIVCRLEISEMDFWGLGGKSSYFSSGYRILLAYKVIGVLFLF
jgi:hypothetical protein